jgi:RHS repeat-associated protein
MIHWLRAFFLAASLLSGAIVGHAHVPSVSIVEDEKSPFRGVTIGTQACSLEEDPTGLLNEGFRYRCLETGIFITRDPAGFVDGPNLYTYVRQNPWTMFDPEGLSEMFVNQPGYGSRFESPNAKVGLHEVKNFVADTVRNADSIKESYSFASQSDRGTAQGWVDTAIGGVGVVANAIDAVANVFTGGLKGMVTGLFEKGAKEGVQMLTKSASDIVKETTDAVTKESTQIVAKSGETAATKAGRQAHKDWNPGEGFEKEYSLPSGKRADAVNLEQKHVKELKPDNERAVKRGEKQVEGYRKELQEEHGGDWTSSVETYKR